MSDAYNLLMGLFVDMDGDAACADGDECLSAQVAVFIMRVSSTRA